MTKSEKFNINKTFFANSIAYSGCNEDSSSELQALNITENDKVVCVTASGGRALNLLLKKPKKLVAIDLNPIQNYLFELKLAGIKHLSYDDYLKFLGVRDSDKRIFLYDQIKNSLSKEAKAFWDERISSILTKGVIYRGNFERFLYCFAFVMRMFRNNKTKELFTFKTIENQREFYEKRWNTPFWTFLTGILFSRPVCRYILQDPGFYQYVPGDVQVHDYLRSRVNHSLKNHLASENFFAAIFFLGQYLDGKALPLYLQKEHFYTLKENIPEIDIEVILEPLEKYLWSLPEGSIDKFSLSDVSAYLNAESFESLLHAVHFAGKPGSIFCLRHFIRKRKIPASVEQKFSYNTELEEELNFSDRTFVYSFKVGQKI